MWPSEAGVIVSAANIDSTSAGFAQPFVIAATPTPPIVDSKPDFSCNDDDGMIGSSIGHFRIESVIASGGMGTVFKATQQQPVKRAVALKMIKRGLADKSTLARFHAERQALALMDHPDIARVYEANATPDGNPYFAMEYCEGLPIDRFCDEQRLDLKARVELIVRIARAVSRAHSIGVVHRDLKPGNVLVAKLDDRSESRLVVKVIDFGIAKFVDEKYDEQSCHATRVGEMVGTPAYMSPEQAAGVGVDGRTDVFAIGAILFKLLTGSTPLIAPPGDAQSLAQVIAHIQNFQPLTPSTRFGTFEPLAKQSIASKMGFTKASQWYTAIKGDLDWVTLRAIESDKTRRYATPDDLAEDLERYLRSEPASAVAPSIGYRLKKLYQRRKPAFLASVVVAITLLVSGIYLAANWWRYESEKRAELAQVSSDARFLMDDADAARQRAAQGGPTSLEEFVVARTALAKAESLLANRSQLPALQNRLNDVQAAIVADQEALELVKQLEDARERVVQTGAALESDADGLDAFGRQAGVARVLHAFRSFGIEPVEMTAQEAADRILSSPKSVHEKIIESLDFLLNEVPIGTGLYLHHQGGRINVAEVVSQGPAFRTQQFQVGDRLLKVDDVSLLETFTVDQMLPQTYRLMTRRPGQRVRLTFVRGAGEPQVCELICEGAEAIWACEVLKSIDPDDWRSSLRRAVLDADLAALRQLAASAELSQQPPYSIIQLAGTLFMLERNNDAIQYLQIAQQRHPSNYWVNHYLGTALAVAHYPPRPDDGMRYLTAAVALRPQSIGARLNLADALVRTGQTHEALVQTQIATELSPSDMQLKKRAVSMSKTKTAAGTLRQSGVKVPDQQSAATVIEPSSSASKAIDLAALTIDEIEHRAREFAQSGDRRQALGIVKQAEQVYSNDPLLRRMKGIVLIDLEDYVAAKVILSDAARLSPNDAATRFYHGVALQYSGDSHNAMREYEAALQIRPDYEAVRGFLIELQAVAD